jgi:hypothetical protein
MNEMSRTPVKYEKQAIGWLLLNGFHYAGNSFGIAKYSFRDLNVFMTAEGYCVGKIGDFTPWEDGCLAGFIASVPKTMTTGDYVAKWHAEDEERKAT